MKVTQLKDTINSVTSELLGKDEVLNEDLSNIVDLGKSIVDSDNIDNYVKKLVNHIGATIFQNRLYQGSVPSVFMSSWEFGSVLEKITSDLPNAEENDTWNLKDGESYDTNVFYQPKVEAKFFNSKVTFDIPLSFTDKQVTESFDNINQLNGFISMLETSVQNSMTVKLDGLIMRTINNMTAQTLLSLKGDYSKGNITNVNLLSSYNAQFGTKLTKEQALNNADFMKYASYVMSLYTDRLKKMSTLFNQGGKERFTPASALHFVLLSEFEKSSNVYLNSDTFHNELVSLPQHETVPYWQASGKSYSFNDTSSINVDVTDDKGKKSNVNISGVIGVMFDSNALGVSNLDSRVTTNYNARAEFYTNFYKFDAGYYNDLNENYVVFYIA